jgi:hypothetical protein
LLGPPYIPESLSRYGNGIAIVVGGFHIGEITQYPGIELGNADNQGLTTQVSQNPSIITDTELQRVIEAWGKLPANLETAIIRSSNFHLY